MWICIWLQILLEIKPDQITLKKYPKNEDLNFLYSFKKGEVIFFTM